MRARVKFDRLSAVIISRVFKLAFCIWQFSSNNLLPLFVCFDDFDLLLNVLLNTSYALSCRKQVKSCTTCSVGFSFASVVNV